MRLLAHGFSRVAASLVALAIVTASCRAVEAEATGEFSIPDCAVAGVAVLADDRHVAINCGPSGVGLVIVDTLATGNSTQVLGVELASEFATGFKALQDGSLAWFGAPSVGPEGRIEAIAAAFGLQKLSIHDAQWRSTLVAPGSLRTYLDPSNGLLEMPSNVAVSAEAQCAAWSDEASFHLVDLADGVARQRNHANTIFLEACVRGVGELQLLTSVPLPSSEWPVIGRRFSIGPLDNLAQTEMTALVLGAPEPIAVSSTQILLLSNKPGGERPPVNGQTAADFDARLCGDYAVVLLDFETRAGRCVYRSRTLVRWFGSAQGRWVFWADDRFWLLDTRTLEVRAIADAHGEPPLGDVSPSGRVIAWVQSAGRVLVMRRATGA